MLSCLPEYENDKKDGKNFLSRKQGYSIEEIDEMLERTIDYLTKKNEKITIICHDFGSLFCMRYAHKRREKVECIVLMDVGANSNHKKADKMKQPFWSFYQLFFAFSFFLGFYVSNALGTMFLRGFLGCFDFIGP